MTYTELTAAICDYTQNFDQDFIDNIPVFVKQAEQRIYNTVQFPSLRKNVTGVTTTNNKYLSAPSDFLAVYSLAVYENFVTSATGFPSQTFILVSNSAGIVPGMSVSGAGIATGATVVSVVPTLAPLAEVTLSAANTGSVYSATFQGAYEYLLNKDVNFIRQAYPTPTSTGIPKYYALFGPTTTNSAPPVITNELSFILGPTPAAAYSVELHYYYYPESISVAASGQTWLGDNFDSVLLYGALVEAITFMKGEADMVQLYNTKYTEALALAKRLGDGMERQDAYRSGQFRQAVT
jgi:hypothetical protein